MDGIKVLLFGAAADRAGTRETVVSAGGITLDELWPGGLEFTADGEVIGDEVAVLPPVSGG